MVNLNLRIFEHAKLCSNDCFEKTDDGELKSLGAESVVACVGCGRKCHLECHKVPKTLSESVKAIPKNNKINSLFGENSYMRLVCENCANWLMMDVPPGTTPSFMMMFTGMVNKLIEDSYILKDDKMKDVTQIAAKKLDTGSSSAIRSTRNSGSGSTLGSKRKRMAGEDVTADNDILIEMKELLMLYTKKLDENEKRSQENVNKIVSKLYGMDESLGISNNKIESGISQISDDIKLVNSNVSKLDGAIDINGSKLSDGLQIGFNKLWDKTEKLLTPKVSFTPRSQFQRNNRGNTFMRKSAILNSTTVTVTPRPSMSVAESSGVATGSSAEQGIFGQVVPRRLFGNETDRLFSHERAVVVSYVDPMITPKKMMDILRKNEVIQRAVNENEGAIEVRRLTKRHMSESDIMQLRFGVSYRIGGSNEICDILQSGILFAPHWEVREWVNREGVEENGKMVLNAQNGTQNDNGLVDNRDHFLQTRDQPVMMDLTK